MKREWTIPLLVMLIFAILIVTASVNILQQVQINQLEKRVEALESTLKLTNATQTNVTKFQDEQVKFNTAVLTMLSEGTWEYR